MVRGLEKVELVEIALVAIGCSLLLLVIVELSALNQFLVVTLFKT